MTFLILIILALYSLYKRYVPVLGVKYITLADLKLDKIIIIDVRDFNESYQSPIKCAINIPIAYLKRNINEIPDSILHVVGSNEIDKNVGIRFLRQKGFNVQGCTIVNQNNLLVQENFCE